MHLTEPRYGSFYLTEKGAVRCCIFVPAHAADAELRSAEDLRLHVERMSGASPEICREGETPGKVQPFSVFVGYGQTAEQAGLPKPRQEGERVILRRMGSSLFLYGNDHASAEGTAFAVTLLLEQLGCGWFGPDELWQVIPKKETLSVSYLNRDLRPRFSSRRPWVLTKNPELGRRWLLGGEYRQIEHAYSLLFPREIYYPSHPEYYAMVNGKRDPYEVEWWQMCYSNEELAQKTAEKVGAFFRQHPEYKQATLSANDGYFEGFCECDACRALGTPSEVMLTFANRVAALLEPEFPEKKLKIFSYFPTWDPPTRPIKAHKNVTILFCKESCMNHSVDEGPACGYHEKYTYEFGHETYPRPWRENVELWKQQTDCQEIGVWEWNCPAAANPVYQDIPFVQGELMGRNLRCFEELGAAYVYFDQGPVEAYHDTEASYPLRWPLWYLSARCCFDRHKTPSEFLLEACNKLFEAAGDLMFAYYTCLADCNGSCDAKNIAWHMPEPEELYPAGCFDRIHRILAAAQAQKPLLSEAAKRRLDNQTALWEKAEQVIVSYAAAKEKDRPSEL